MASDLYQNIFATVLARVQAALEALVASAALPGGLALSRVLVEPPRDATHGDMATNAATALANLLAFAGHDVTREYYINDAGAQVDVLARSAFLRYREALGEKIEIPEGLYPGDYLRPVGEALAAEHGGALNRMPEAQWLPL